VEYVSLLPFSTIYLNFFNCIFNCVFFDLFVFSSLALFFVQATVVSVIAKDSPYKLVFSVNNLENSQSGQFTVEVHPEWAPKAAKRFELLFEEHLFEDSRFAKVSADFTAQFGIGGSSSDVPKEWNDFEVAPGERKVKNTRGTLAFVPSAEDTPRKSQIVLNMKDNTIMDCSPSQGA